MVDDSANAPTRERAAAADGSAGGRDESARDESNVLPPINVVRATGPTNDRASPSKTPTKGTSRTQSRAQTRPRTPTPTINNNTRAPTPTTTNSARAPTPQSNKHARAPTPTLPPLASPNQRTATPIANATDARSATWPPTRVNLITYEPAYNSSFPCKLTSLQLAAALKPFWADLLANQLKAVRRHAGELHLKKLDLNAAAVRFAANADATPLHLCAQYGLLPMAKMLVAEFALAATLRNKVGSTPLHVACRQGKREFVSWLLDDVRVPLDVPDAQFRTALDVASFETVEKCVLAPLQLQRAALSQHEAEFEGQHLEAQQRLEDAQLAFRRNSMVLCDTEGRADELRAELDEVGALERHWHGQWLARNTVLDELVVRYESQRQELADEEQRAQDLYEQEVKVARDEHESARKELEELQDLVSTTQCELDHRRQLLVDQLGVFDASLREFSGNTDVQKWALATLIAIAHNDSSDTEGEVDRTELLLRAEPVAVVGHVLSTFPTDHELQYEALELLVVVLRLHESSGGSTGDTFAAVVVESDMLQHLGDVLARWCGSEGAALGSPMTMKTLEAMYLGLGLGRCAPRIRAFCQHKAVQLTALHVIQHIVCSEEEASITSRQLRKYAARVLLTQVKYGVKKVLLCAGVVRTIFDTLQRVSVELGNHDGTDHDRDRETEAILYLFATLALLASSYGTGAGDTNRDRRGKCREPARLEELTRDVDCIDALVVTNCVRVGVLPFARHASAVPATMWAFKLLINLSLHGGEAARHVREQLLREEVSRDNHEDPVAIVLRGMRQAMAASAQDIRSEADAVLAGLELLRIVWIERFDQEGRVPPTHADVVRCVPEITAALVQHLLVYSFVNATSVVLDATGSLYAITSIAQNPLNGAALTKRSDISIEHDILRPIIHWTLRFVDETGASYREPNLVSLLVRVLHLFLLLTQARRHSQAALLQAASDSEVASFYRSLHDQSRAIGVCAILKVFHDADVTETKEPTPPEWMALRALCSQIHTLTHCSC